MTQNAKAPGRFQLELSNETDRCSVDRRSTDRSVDRRKRRSRDRVLALRYQLEHTLQHGGLDAVTLSDSDGLVVANSGPERICGELGAYAPLIARTKDALPRSSPLQGADIAVRVVSAFGAQFYLATVGGTMARDALLAGTVQGLTRILESN